MGEENKALVEENFKALVDSFAVELLKDSAYEMVERALKGHARKWGGCISCVFSRRHPETRPEDTQNWWYRRKCTLGLKQDTCGKHLAFPEDLRMRKKRVPTTTPLLFNRAGVSARSPTIFNSTKLSNENKDEIIGSLIEILEIIGSLIKILSEDKEES